MHLDIGSVISQMGILLAIIAVGFAAAKCGVFPAGTNRVLAQLVILITNPCTVLHSALTGDRALSNGAVLQLTVIAVLGFAVLIGFGQLMPRLLRVPRSERNVYAFMATFTNMGFMGFPVVRAIYGEGAVFYAAIFNLVFQFVVYTYGVWLLTRGRAVENAGPCNGKSETDSGRKEQGKTVSWRIFLSPIIVASILAYVCYLTGFQAPEAVTRGLGMLGDVTSPVCMLVIGIALSQVPFRKVFTNWRLYVISALRLLVLPLGFYFGLRGLVGNPLMLGITVTLFGMPIATLSTLLTEKYGGDTKLAASGVFLSTLLSMATIPLLMWLLFA